jgi:hypothetical protein
MAEPKFDAAFAAMRSHDLARTHRSTWSRPFRETMEKP